ncbi:MAG: hypothetical protein R2725_14625 [Solirubrobacterales bacterium]
MADSKIFIGFASSPTTLADTLRTASDQLAKVGGLRLRTWEDLRVAGHLLLDEIEKAIRGTDVAVFDLTQLNENVLFEVGIAIGANRVIWPLRDATDETRKNEWSTIGLLDQLGHVRFTSSEDIVGAFMAERPDLQSKPLSEDTLQPQLKAGRPPSILYVAEPVQTDAGRASLNVLSARSSDHLPLVSADPSEASVQTLPWFFQHVYSAEAVVVHLASKRRSGAATHNARASLVAGLARGLNKPLLMLAENDFVSALDYRDLLYPYPDAASCRTRLEHWLNRTLQPIQRRIAETREATASLRLSTELRSVDLGEYVAENEVSGLNEYYVETSTYRDVLAGDSRVYVGSKGTGKSAAAISAEAALKADARKLVCSIKPQGYDLNGLVRLFSSIEAADAKGYVAESLWKYLLATELALAVEQDLSRRPAGSVPDDPEWKLLEFISENSSWLKMDFASRLERAVTELLANSEQGGIADARERISEVLHQGPLKTLRTLLAPVLSDRERVYIIVDNLDKAWDKDADAPQLSRLLLGLLACMDAFRSEMERAARGQAVPISLSLFIRSDIFAAVTLIAREPDKLPTQRIRWPTGDALLDVIERRYIASQEREVAASELWSRYFCPNVDGSGTRDWLVSRCLPRPRDVLYLTRAAIDQAVGNRHPRVEEQDLRAAEREYSLFAFEAALVEGFQRVPRIDDVLLEFAGASAELTEGHLREIVRTAKIADGEIDHVIDVLRDLSFIGTLGGSEGAIFTDSPREKSRADVLLRKRRKRDKALPVFKIHPAFWAYLDIARHPASLSLGI